MGLSSLITVRSSSRTLAGQITFFLRVLMCALLFARKHTEADPGHDEPEADQCDGQPLRVDVGPYYDHHYATQADREKDPQAFLAIHG